MGKHVNQLRKNTTNESLAKRAKELVKKWRSMVLPDSNGQLKQVNTPPHQEDSDQGQFMTKKRPAKDKLENSNVKRSRINGQTSEFEFSDNSNSSFKDVINTSANVADLCKRDVILINSDSNSSLPEKLDPLLEQQLPKKRGRKKGSKNHKNLLDEAETSFTNKMAVSRGNAKVKTTQELIASLQNKNSNSINLPPLSSKPIEDLNERAAKLTQRVSIIDQKLNTNANRYKNAQRKGVQTKVEKVIESGSVVNVRNVQNAEKPKESISSLQADQDVIVVDDIEPETQPQIKEEKPTVKVEETLNVVTSLSVEEVLAKLPPIDASVLDEEEPIQCTCQVITSKSDFFIEDSDVDLGPKYEIVEDCQCPARLYLEDRYHFGAVTEERISELHSTFIPNVNGNCSLGFPKPGPELLENGLFVNVVPNVNIERIPKNPKPNFPSENFKKYSISDSGNVQGVHGTDESENNCTINKNGDASDKSDETFREWHEIVETPSYNGEILKILPYVIID